jgi:hypothetical protein
MSLWQFECCVNGYIEANSPDDDKTLTDDQVNAIGDWIDGN